MENLVAPAPKVAATKLQRRKVVDAQARESKPLPFGSKSNVTLQLTLSISFQVVRLTLVQIISSNKILNKNQQVASLKQ